MRGYFALVGFPADFAFSRVGQPLLEALDGGAGVVYPVQHTGRSDPLHQSSKGVDVSGSFFVEVEHADSACLLFCNGRFHKLPWRIPRR